MYNLKILFRNLYRNALYTWINIIGLAISLTAAIFILLWVQDEWSYDKFYEHADDIYVVFDHSVNGGIEEYNEYLPVPLARAIQTELAEVKAATAIGYEWDLAYLDYEGTKFFSNHYADFAQVDSSFFNVFNLEFIEGDSQNAFTNANSIIITDELAFILFGNETALGKQLSANSGGPYYVSAVVKKSPENTLLQFKALLSFEQSYRMQRWNQWTSRSFVRLNPNANSKVVGEKIGQLHEKHNKNYKADFPTILQPLTQYHLYAADGSETGMKNVRLFVIVSIVLLVIACINYVNLVTARVRRRIKEISVRKIIGANKAQLFTQMMAETIFLLVAAVILAIFFAYLLTPCYNELTGRQILFSVFNANVLLLLLPCFLFITILAGVYPAVLLSSIKPLKAFKSEALEVNKVLSFRRLLIILQFTCSVAFILATIVASSQQRYMQTKNLGYDRENIFTMDIISNDDAIKHYDTFKQKLEQQEGVVGVTASQHNILDVGNFTGFSWEGAPPEVSHSIRIMGIDRNFFNVLKLNIKNGVGYNGTASDSLCLFVNEALVKMIGVDDPLNTTIFIGGGWLVGKITAVIEDFHFSHMSEPIGPIVMYLPDSYWTVYVKAAPGKTQKAIESTEKVWRQFNPGYPLMYEFMDDTFDEMYRDDIRTRNLFSVFTIVAIFVSCLGLFGLATYTAESRTKEIGIRKTLGANVSNMVVMLSKEFITLVGIGVVIGIPIAYFFMEKMLQSYAYRISITWWMILTAILIVLVIVVITVSAQALQAARANPVKAIKTE